MGSHSPRACPVDLMCLQLKTHMAIGLHFGEEGSVTQAKKIKGGEEVSCNLKTNVL